MKGSFNASNELGISAVTPAYKLHELLFSERLKQQRKSFQSVS